MKKLTLIFAMMCALVGLNTNAAIYLVGGAPFGQGWDPSKGVEMTDQGDGIYTFTAEVNGAVYFCFADGLDSDWNVFNGTYRYGPTGGADQTVESGTWTATQRQGNGSGSYKFIGSGEEYTVTFDLNNLQFKIDGYVAPISYSSLTVVGSEANLFGTQWDPTNTDNDMTLVDGLYTWSMENVVLAAGSFKFKVVADHDTLYTNAWPSSDYVQAVAVKGYYNVTITFNPDDEEVACNLELVEEIPDTEEHTYTVAGTANVFTNAWDEKDSTAINQMTLGEDGIYTLTKNNVELAVNDTVKFKVVKDHNWDLAWPADDYIFIPESEGEYNIVITFNPENNEVGFTATLVEDPVVPVDPITGNLYVLGQVNGNDWGSNVGVAMDNPTGDEDTFVLEDATINGYFSFTSLLAETWDEIASYRRAAGEVREITSEMLGTNVALSAWGENIDSAFTVAPAIYDIEVCLSANYVKLTYVGEIPAEEYTGDVFIMGEVNGNGWAPNVGVQMTRDAENKVYTATVTTAGENDGYSFFSFTKMLAENESDWDGIASYRMGATENDFLVTEDLLGTTLAIQDGQNAFKIPAGEWNLTLSVDNKTLVISEATGLRGDVDGNGSVDISDVTALIDFLLSGDATGINQANADCDQSGAIDISDVTALIDFLLSGAW